MMIPTAIPRGVTRTKVNRYTAYNIFLVPAWESSRNTQKVMTNLWVPIAEGII